MGLDVAEVAALKLGELWALLEGHVVGRNEVQAPCTELRGTMLLCDMQ